MAFYETFGFLVFWALLVGLLIKLLKGVYTCGLGAALGQGYKWKPGNDSWAIVTGATDGIGLEYAKQLGKKGYNLLLLSRTQHKLDETKETLKQQCPKCNEIRTLAVDFSKLDIYDKIQEEVDKLDRVEVLVNNVGTSYEYPEYFNKIPNSLKLVEQMINMNIIAGTRLIHMILPKMENQKKGLIINISSLSGTNPTPLLSLYSATKSYMDFLSRGLNLEYADKNIVIQSVMPAFVSTKLSKMRPSLMIPTAKNYVASALNTVGLESRTYGYWTHKLQGFVLDTIIAGLFGPDANSKLYFKSVKDVRRRYYKKNNLKED